MALPFGVAESPDPQPILTVSIPDLEKTLRVPEGVLAQLLTLAGNFDQYSKAYKSLVAGTSLKIPAETLGGLNTLLLLVDQVTAAAVLSFEQTQNPDVAALLEILTGIEDSVMQLRIMPALAGLDVSADGSTAIKAVTYRVQQGDTLESVAAKTTGNAANWVDIARYNDLNLGIVGSESPLNLWVGLSLNIPVAASNPLFTRDLSVWDATAGAKALGRNFSSTLTTRTRADGTVDINVLDYTNTLLEGLSARLETQLGSVPDSPEFGSYLPLVFGHNTGDVTDRMLEVHLEAALLADPRVQEVLNLQLARDQNSLVATFHVRTINGITTSQLLAAFNPSDATLLDAQA